MAVWLPFHYKTSLQILWALETSVNWRHVQGAFHVVSRFGLTVFLCKNVLRSTFFVKMIYFTLKTPTELVSKQRRPFFNELGNGMPLNKKPCGLSTK